MNSILRTGRIACAMLAIVSATVAYSAVAPGSKSARSLITQKIDNNTRVTLEHNVRPELTAKTDLGPVEDTMPIARMFLVLKRTPEQQAAIANLIERQHQATAPEFHKWLTPVQVGERFGASEADIATVTDWLSSQGFTVNYVTHNNSMIDFSGTARTVREAFHTQLHYVDINGERRVANAQDPQIPAALAPIVGGIVNLENIPPHADHTPIRHVTFDKNNHTWHSDQPSEDLSLHPQYSDGSGDYLITPQDFYTIYNENPLLSAGHTGASATIAVIEQTAIVYGTVNGTTHQAAGGDVATFRTTFGVPGTLNMYVYNGYGSTNCTPPGIVGDEGEATLDAEWATAVAPSAKLIFMACANNNTLEGGIYASMTALIDNNLADAMSLSYGDSALNFSNYAFFDSLASTAATQGQSIFISTGDSGSDVADQNTSGTATSGINVSGFSDGPYITATGGTDYQDYYDAQEGGPSQSTYWSATNSSTYGDAISYVPETSWNNSCASSIVANYYGAGDAPVAFCNAGAGGVAGAVVGGSGGFSTHYAAPSYQTGITGFSGSKRAQPDIAMFAGNGVWGHYLVFCDTTEGASCANASDFAGAGGTSFVAPQMAGLGGLLTDYTGSRQGVLNYALYALAKAQFTNAATKSSCYANGQTSNDGVTTGLPISSCIFHDVTTSNNDVPCASGATDCYTGGSSYGVLSTTGSSSLTTAYNSGIGYDEVSGIGSININNLLTKWNTAFTSTTKLTASATTITTAQSTTLTATVTGGTPAGYTGRAPTLAGSVNFYSGSIKVGTCTLASGTCNISVTGATLGVGTDSVTAVFVGSSAYPTSTSTPVSITVTSASVNTTTTVTATPSSATQGASVALKATVTATSGTATGTVTFKVGSSTSLGTCALSSGACTLSTTALPVGSDTVTASYGGATGFNTSSGTVSVTITAASLNTTTTVTATPSSAPYGESVAIKATVTAASGTPTGTVTFTSGTTSLGSCTLSSGTCTVPILLAVGSDTVTASYGGVTGFNTSSGTVKVTITPDTTTTALTATPNPAVVGQSVTLKATVTAAHDNPQGSVSFAVGTTSLGSCTLTSDACSLSASSSTLTAGTYPVVATYAGGTNNAASSSSTVNVVLTKANTTTTLTVSPTTVTPPGDVTLTATIKRNAPGAGTPTGTVTFKTGTTTIGTATLNASGVAKLTSPTTGVPAGTYPLSATYSGDASDNTSSGTASVKVN